MHLDEYCRPQHHLAVVENEHGHHILRQREVRNDCFRISSFDTDTSQCVEIDVDRRTHGNEQTVLNEHPSDASVEANIGPAVADVDNVDNVETTVFTHNSREVRDAKLFVCTKQVRTVPSRHTSFERRSPNFTWTYINKSECASQSAAVCTCCCCTCCRQNAEIWVEVETKVLLYSE